VNALIIPLQKIIAPSLERARNFKFLGERLEYFVCFNFFTLVIVKKLMVNFEPRSSYIFFTLDIGEWNIFGYKVLGTCM